MPTRTDALCRSSLKASATTTGRCSPTDAPTETGGHRMTRGQGQSRSHPWPGTMAMLLAAAIGLLPQASIRAQGGQPLALVWGTHLGDLSLSVRNVSGRSMRVTFWFGRCENVLFGCDAGYNVPVVAGGAVGSWTFRRSDKSRPPTVHFEYRYEFIGPDPAEERARQERERAQREAARAAEQARRGGKWSRHGVGPTC